MKEMESTQWDQWKQVPSSNDVRVVVSFWNLSGHKEYKDFRFRFCFLLYWALYVEMFLGVIHLKFSSLLSHIYTSIVQVEMFKYMYVGNGMEWPFKDILSMPSVIKVIKQRSKHDMVHASKFSPQKDFPKILNQTTTNR